MHIIKSIEINGFRGQSKDIKIILDRNANFIIGRNGTGKTTLINLINAVLSKDVPTLRDTDFKSVTVKLKKDGSNKNPIVTVFRDFNQDHQIISYNIQESRSESPELYSVYRRDARRMKNASSKGVVTRFVEPRVEDVPLSKKNLNQRLAELFRVLGYRCIAGMSKLRTRIMMTADGFTGAKSDDLTSTGDWSKCSQVFQVIFSA